MVANSNSGGVDNSGINGNTGRRFPKKWIIIGIMALIGFWFFQSYRTMAQSEVGIQMQGKRVITAIDSLVKKIEGQGSVVKNYSATLKDTITAYVNGRGGNSASLMKAVSEAIPQVPAEVWNNMAQTINAEYEAVESAQNTKIAKLESYSKMLVNPVHMPVKIIFGFPHINLDEEGKLIVGSKARDAEKTKEFEGVDPFSDKEKK